MDDASPVFRALGPRTAEWTTARSGALSLAHDKRSRRYDLGLSKSPRFKLHSPLTPDDPWDIEVDPQGATASGLPDESGPAIERAAEWLGRPLDGASQRLLCALPAGRYTLVRSALPALSPDSILLGNEKVKRPESALEIGYVPPFYAAIFGASKDAPPALGSLLVGTAVLNYAGTSLLDGAWLFDLAGPLSAPAVPGELFLAIPLEGELVIDAMATFDPRGVEKSAARWKNERGPALVAWMSGQA